jgi:hypothetical protein
MPDISTLYKIVTQQNRTLEKDKEYHDKLSFLTTGESKREYIKIIKGFESKSIKEIRKEYGKPVNWLFSWILAPVGNIFTAQGGTLEIDDKAKDQDIALLERLSNIEKYGNLNEFMQKWWLPHYINDPAGLCLIEHDGENAWPTIVSVDDILAYSLNGRFVNWVVFNPVNVIISGGKRVKSWRIYSEEGDNMYIISGTKLVQIDTYIDVESGVEKQANYPIPQVWEGGVPAFILGDIPDTNKKYKKLSVIDDIVNLGMEIYNLDTIRAFVAIKNGYGTYWWATRPCKTCGAEGTLSDGSECKVCGGSGRIAPENVNDIYLWDVEAGEDVPNKPGGVIEGDTTGWKQYIEQIDKKTRDTELGMWGTHRIEKGSNNTATGEFVDAQTATFTLIGLSKSAETAETFIIRLLGKYYSPTFNTAYKTYGRRYLIESTDALWNKYLKSKKDGAPLATLNRQLTEYYESLYKYDYSILQRMIKMLEVEPYVHYSLEQVKSFASAFEIKKKAYFQQWAAIQDSDTVKNTDVAGLDKLLIDFTNEKIKQNGEQNTGGEA